MSGLDRKNSDIVLKFKLQHLSWLVMKMYVFPQTNRKSQQFQQEVNVNEKHHEMYGNYLL